jgi:DUF1680 family protein
VKSLGITIALALPLYAAIPKPVVADKVADKFISAPFDQQEITGFLGERMRVNLKGRLLRVDENGLISGFQKRPGSHPWIGEHVGKFLHAAANTYEFTHDAKLKALMDRLAMELIATQLPDGYLGTYTDDKRWTSWDVWVHKYDLIGLLSYYQVTGYEPALESSKKVGDLLVRTFGEGPGQRDIIKSGTHVGMAATSVLEPICMLYRYTGDRKYLDFAHYIVHSYDQPHGPKIIDTILKTGSVFQTANAKAYEMLSNIVGLVDLYRLTGDEKLFKVARIAWDDVAKNRLYISGTASSHEHFQDNSKFPADESADVGEGCVTVTWIQLTWHLLRLTGEHKYADELERSVFNQLLAAQDPQNGNICYFTPLIGRKNATPGINCCVSSEPRGISMIPQLTWGALDGGIAVLLYTPGAVTIDGNQLIEQTNFPDSGKVTFYVHPGGKKAEFPIYLRVPYWTSKFNVNVNGKPAETGTPGHFVKLERVWKQADKIDVDMDMTVRVLSGGASYPNAIAFQRGPQILALDSESNPNVEFLHAAAANSEKLGASGNSRFTLDGIVASADGSKKEQKLTLIPFTEASRYRVWLTKSDALPQSPVNVAAFGKESVSRRGKSTGSIADEDSDTYRTTNDGKTAEEDWYAVELNRPATITRVVFRHGKSTEDGGWFDGKPSIQIRRGVAGQWETVAQLEEYKGGPTMEDGQEFVARLQDPIEISAIRIVGKPAKTYTSCAEIAAYVK